MKGIYPVMLPVLMFLIFTQTGFGQYFDIKGVIHNSSDNSALAGSHIFLSRGFDSLLIIKTTNDKGEFLIEKINAGKYLLEISFVGFGSISRALTITNENIDLGIIKLDPKETPIEEVEVHGKVPAAKLIGDTVQYNADAFKTMPDANAEDLVTKMPGVVVSDGKVQAQGEDVKEVLVDGRPFFGNDPITALRTLPAEIVDKIQIYDKRNEQAEFTGFDDGNTTKTMNLITRINMRNGKFGKAYAGYGTDGKYILNGNINSFNNDQRISLLVLSNNIDRQNFSSEDLLGIMSSSGRGRGRMGGRGGAAIGAGSPGESRMAGPVNDAGDFLIGQQNGISKVHSAGINYSDRLGDKIELSGSYFFNLTNNASLNETNRIYTAEKDSGMKYFEENIGESRNINHRLNIKLDYDISDNTSLLFRPRLSLQSNSGYSNFSGKNIRGMNDLNMSIAEDSSDLFAADFSSLLLFRHRFAKAGRTFSINMNTNYSGNEGEKELYSLTTYFTPQSSSQLLNQQAYLNTDSYTFSGNISYTEPLGDSALVQLNYSSRYMNNDTEQETFNYNEISKNYDLFDTLLSNSFYNNYLSQQVGAGYRYRNNKLYLMGQLAYQVSALKNQQIFPEDFDIERNFTNVIVTLSARYGKSMRENFNLVYRTNTDPPSLSQLQEVIDNSNPLQLKTGNAKLDQSYIHNLNLRYINIKPEQSRVFFAMLSATLKDNYIAGHQIFAYRDTMLFNGILLKSGTRLTYPVNLGEQYQIRSLLTYGIPVYFLRSNLNFNLGGTITRSPAKYNEISYFSHNKNLTAGIVFSSNISEKIDFSLSSQSNLGFVSNDLYEDQNTSYLNQLSRFRIKWIIYKNLLVESDMIHRVYAGYSENYNQHYLLWNAGVGSKVFKNQRGELQLTVFDLLSQNKNISRNVSDFYYEDVKTHILQRYVMLTFTYNLRSFPGTGRGPGRFQGPYDRGPGRFPGPPGRF